MERPRVSTLVSSPLSLLLPAHAMHQSESEHTLRRGQLPAVKPHPAFPAEASYIMEQRQVPALPFPNSWLTKSMHVMKRW